MNKDLIFKIALGLIVVAIPVSMLLNSKGEDKTMDEMSQVVQEDTEILDDLYSDTFEGSDSEDSSEDLTDEYTETEDIEEVITESTTEDTEDNKDDEVSENAKTVTGEFQGFADGNFIEVKIGNEYSVFKVSSSVKSKIESKNVGDSITFTYTASAGQQVITSVN